MQYLSSGTLLERAKVCGYPNCYCARDPAVCHGPNYEWNYLKGGRPHQRTFTPKQGEPMRLAIANYREAKKPVRTREAHIQGLIELKTPEWPSLSREEITRKLPWRRAESKASLSLTEFCRCVGIRRSRIVGDFVDGEITSTSYYFEFGRLGVGSLRPTAIVEIH